MKSTKRTVKDDEGTRKLQAHGALQYYVQRNWAFAALVFCVLIISSQGVSFASVWPLIKVVPVISTLDADGHVVQTQVATPQILSANVAYQEQEINSFIVACNTVDPYEKQYFSDECHLRSTEDVGKQIDHEFASDSPTNPYVLAGIGGRTQVKIGEISMLGPDAAQIHYTLITDHAGDQRSEKKFFVAVVRFVFTVKPIEVKNRWVNGLGFLVFDYHKDEQLSASSPALRPMPTASGAPNKE